MLLLLHQRMSTTELLIADYLRRKGLYNTLRSFEADIGVSTNDSIKYEPLEHIVEDRIRYLEHDISIPKTNDTLVNNGMFQQWSEPTVEQGQELDIHELVIHISISDFKINGLIEKVLFVTTSDKKLTLIDLKTKKVIKVLIGLHSSVGKCAYGINGTNRFLSCGMDGLIKLFKLENDHEAQKISETQLHRRIVTDLKIWYNEDEIYIFSIGWDLQLKVSIIKDSVIKIISNFKLLSNATSISLSQFKSIPILFLTRLDSTQLSLFTFQQSRLFEISRLSLNDAEFSTHGFTPVSISVSTSIITQSTLIAIGTSHIPYMRLIILTLPDLEPLISNLYEELPLEQHLTSTPINRGHILVNYNTLAPQDKYSTGVVAWRIDKSGVWISGDDGVIRGIDLKNGEIVKQLKDKHDKRIKCMIIDQIDSKEIIISSGIDKHLNYWD